MKGLFVMTIGVDDNKKKAIHTLYNRKYQCSTVFALAVFVIVSLLLLPFDLFGQPGRETYRYAVVIKSDAYKDIGWKAVADTLMSIHGKTAAKLFQWNSSVTEVKSELSKFLPDYIAYVCRPVTDVNNSFVRTLLKFNREIDSDPYYDAVWSVVTGYVPQDAIRAAKSSIRIKTCVTGPDGVTLRSKQGVAFSANAPDARYVFSDGKEMDASDATVIGPDRIVPICKWLNNGINIEKSGNPAINGPLDLFVTGGHGNVDNWQAHYPSPGSEGFVKSKDGKLYGDPHSGNDITINKTTPTVYFAINNCLIGCPDNINNMVYAWFHSGGATHMYGFIVETSASHAGYATYCRMTDKINPSEAYFLAMNNIAFICEKNIVFPTWNKDEYLFNLQNTIMYGDPRGNVFYDPSYRAYSKDVENTIERIKAAPEAPDTFVFTSTWNTTAYEAYEWWQRDLRPVMFLPIRIDPSTVKVIKSDLHNQVICDDILIADPWRYGESKVGTKKKLTWTAKVFDPYTGVSPKPVVAKRQKLDAIFFSNTNTVSLHFDLQIHGDAELLIVNASGREIFRKKFTSEAKTSTCYTLNLSDSEMNLPNGVYQALLLYNGIFAHDAFLYVR